MKTNEKKQTELNIQIRKKLKNKNSCQMMCMSWVLKKFI